MNKFNLFKISLIIISIMAGIGCEKFSALSELEKLAYDEEKIIEEFTKFIEKLENEVVHLRRKLQLWKEEYEQVQKNIENYVTNPINAFLMIKRTSTDIYELQNEIAEDIVTFSEKIEEIQSNTEDLDGAVNGLLRLQKMYKLKTDDIVNGVIDGDKISNKLSSRDLLVIIKTAIANNRKDKIIGEYLSELRKRIANHETENRHKFEIVTEESLFKIHGFEGVHFYLQDFENFTKTQVYTGQKEAAIYNRMCRKENLKSPKESKFLKCRYISNSPFSKIAPFKVEEADHSVNLLLFHDVVYDSEIEILKNMSRTRFIRGLVFGKKKDTEKSNNRVAKIAWLQDYEHPIVERISKRVEDMTGLTTKTAEELQIQNYGIGGHYVPHWDMKLKNEKPFEMGTGNRIATVLFYLSTVEKGGATIFPYLKVYVPAIKGMAAFWYNLRDNGDDDYYTRHAACPVLLGSKWVANKWIHEYEQEFRRPCSTKYQEPTSEEAYIKEFY